MFHLGVVLMVIGSASSSAPGVLVGPDTYTEFVAKAVSVKKVNLRIANSDVSTLPPADFWEVEMEILSSTLHDAKTEEKIPGDPLDGRVLFHFPLTQEIKKGSRIEGRTFSRKEMSQRWHSQNSFLKRYKIIP